MPQARHGPDWTLPLKWFSGRCGRDGCTKPNQLPPWLLADSPNTGAVTSKSLVCPGFTDRDVAEHRHPGADPPHSAGIAAGSRPRERPDRRASPTRLRPAWADASQASRRTMEASANPEARPDWCSLRAPPVRTHAVTADGSASVHVTNALEDFDDRDVLGQITGRPRQGRRRGPPTPAGARTTPAPGSPVTVGAAAPRRRRRPVRASTGPASPRRDDHTRRARQHARRPRRFQITSRSGPADTTRASPHLING
jgi:hypothetical protein